MKKEDRRLKQRSQNIFRAKKMHEARISGKIEPYNPPSVLQNSKKPKIYIGCSGWFYWGWKGIFYNEKLPMNQWFEHYSNNFKTVELNAPFYSWPTIATVQNWIRQTKKKPFIYTVKVCELITHIKRFTGTKTLIKDFTLITDILGPLMGCLLFQLPPSFSYTKSRLKKILSQLDTGKKNVVEFRHKTWWNKEVFSAFKKAGIIFCSCSAPRLPEQLVKTSDDIYIRFHGTQKWYRHDYSNQELDKWAHWIKASKAKTIWIYFNNDANGYAIKNAKELSQLLGLSEDYPVTTQK